MRYSQALWIIIFPLFILSCRKEYALPPPTPPPSEPVKKILLKDIRIPNLPSPYYHFEYNADSTVAKVGFADGFTNYDVIYAGNKIAEMRNNIIVNHDTLRYVYDEQGKVSLIKFINQSNVTYRLVNFMYNGDLVKEISWDQKVDNTGYIIDRTLKFEYYADGNVKTISEHRPDTGGSPGSNSITLFEQYDNKINVDDFSLIHAGFSDHLFLLQGFRLQKNNPGKVTFTQDSNLNNNITNYTYTYNSDNTPSGNKGVLTFTAGPQAGQTFQVSTDYTYY